MAQFTWTLSLDIEQLEMLSHATNGNYPLEKLCPDFRTQLEDDFKTMEEIINSGTSERMSELLHRTQGGVSSLGMKAMSEIIQNIREELKATGIMPTIKTIQALEALATETFEAYKKANYVRQDFQW